MPTTMLPAAWGVPNELRERLGTQAGRQRAMAADGHLLLVLHAAPAADDSGRAGRFFWRSPDGKWMSNEHGTGTNAVSTHLDEYEDAIARLDRDEEEAESAEEYFRVLDHLAPVYRAAQNMHCVLQEARKASPEYLDIINLRDRAYEIERTAELLYNGTKTALDFVVARQVEEHALASGRMATAAHRLNILAAFFFPIATLTALFGVNMLHGFENDNAPWPFLALIAAGMACGLVLAHFIPRPNDKNNT
jgi:Mg2+ and Co2+ transporter CorA